MDQQTSVKDCSRCRTQFVVGDDERQLRLKLDAPEPANCPECREQLRLSFRNERSLYARSCPLCCRRMLSVFAPEKPYRVLCPQCWYSDRWDAKDAGREFDFSRPFFQQFAELILASPLLATLSRNNENSDYVNQETDDKNCYYNFGGHYNEDCYYNTYSLYGKNCVDNYWVLHCQLCYECLECEKCYNSTFLQNCRACSDSHFCRECSSCTSCFGCFGLRRQHHCFFNEQLSAEEYRRRIERYRGTASAQSAALRESAAHFLGYPHRATNQRRTENCCGESIINSSNTREAYLAEEAQDCQYLYIAFKTKDCADLTSVGWAELVCQASSSMELNDVYAAMHSASLHACRYVYMCLNSSDLFGCVGMDRAQYCILNRQYSRQEYELLRRDVIAHMKKSGEWGDFFPPALSPFAYNETVAQEYYPLPRNQALAAGWSWRGESAKPASEHQVLAASSLPDAISEVPDDILSAAIGCAASGKLFRIQKPELEFYRRNLLPLPRYHPDVRHQRRLSLRNPRRLWLHHCSNCAAAIRSTFAPESAQIIYCGVCWDKEFTD